MPDACPPGPIEVRPVRVFDLDLLSALHAACFEEGWAPGSFAGLLSAPGTFGYLAEAETGAAGGRGPAGFVLVRVAADEAEILTLGVLPGGRRQGVGTALLRAAAVQAEREGARRLFLEVAEDNPAGRGLYTAAGFQPAGSRPGYYRRRNSPGSAAIILVKALPTA